MTKPIVNGTSSVVLRASTPELLRSAVTFYQEFAHLTIKSETKTNVILSSGQKFPENSTNIEIALDEKYTQPDVTLLKQGQTSLDWRSISSAVVFKATSLVDLYAYVKAREDVISFQVYPSELAPIELYIIDPLNYIVGFTSVTHPLSRKPKIVSPKLDAPISTPPSAASESTTPALIEASGSTASPVKRNIAVLTSGGDSPGMNCNVRAVVRAALYR
ncbi:hypothetical protein WICPIJ_005088, partial [Wickerhamomyces pijperi]